MSYDETTGCVLVFCHAGCSTHDIVSAIGLRLADLFERRSGRSTSEWRTAALKRIESGWEPTEEQFRLAFQDAHRQAQQTRRQREKAAQTPFPSPPCAVGSGVALSPAGRPPYQRPHRADPSTGLLRRVNDLIRINRRCVNRDPLLGALLRGLRWQARGNGLTILAQRRDLGRVKGQPSPP